ncbi:hypothetical protein BV22DRAFT_1198366 [Leucogyrophana mollusca]|uniref:Uncharacterized protein n=1 Tax=Leucogyrophana mollusca TaxID=85980 RepID=A0ACB8B8U2_9AGAM|nr:hypothetical protein BV22DRAFT_1198366 [Leucogyrophana mollusca]
MHHCLRVAEILTIIFSHLRRDLRALAFLARTCRTFQGPASDILWADVRRLTPLVKCLPEDLWSVGPPGVPTNMRAFPLRGQVLFLRPMVLKDWIIFRRYSQRVRNLEISSANAAIFRALCNPPDPSYLFPGLLSLRWSNKATQQDAIPFLRSLIKPTLLSISLPARIYRQIDVTSLGLLCPNIQCILLGEDPDGEGYLTADVGSRMIRQCQTLKRFDCFSTISDETLLQLACLPALESLSFTPSNTTSFGHLKGLPQAFPALRELTVVAHVFVPFMAFLESVDLALITLNIRGTAAFGNTGIPDNLFAMLPSQCRRDTLSSIHISDEWQPRMDLLTYDPEYLRPLSAFKNLTSLVIRTTRSLLLNDDNLKELALAWPRLENLQLVSSHSWRVQPSITLPGLLPLLEHCPRLASLAILVDTTTTPAKASQLPGKGIRNTLLTEINVDRSRISSPVFVAAFLSDILPNLRRIRAIRAITRGRPWREVERMLSAFAMVRNQERTWRDHLGDDGAEIDWDEDGTAIDWDEDSSDQSHSEDDLSDRWELGSNGE